MKKCEKEWKEEEIITKKGATFPLYAIYRLFISNRSSKSGQSEQCGVSGENFAKIRESKQEKDREERQTLQRNTNWWTGTNKIFIWYANIWRNNEKTGKRKEIIANNCFVIYSHFL